MGIRAGLIDLASMVTGLLPNANLDGMAEATFKGRASGAGTGAPIDLSADQASTILDTASDPFLRTSAGGSGGNGTSTAAYASRPAAGTDGNLFFPNNGYYVERDSGSVWAPWGPLFPLTAPSDTGFSWVNQGTSSIVTTNGGIALIPQAGAGSDSLRVRVKTAPSTPYTITAAVLIAAQNVNFGSAGLVFRESSSSKLHSLGPLYVNSTSNMYVRRWTSATAWASADDATTGMAGTAGPVLWLRLADNATNLIFSWSVDGVNFIQSASVSRTVHMAGGPDQVGFYVNPAGSGAVTLLTLLSWKET